MRCIERPTAAGWRPTASATRIAVSRRAILDAKVVSTTRFCSPPTSACKLSRTSASEPDVPGLRMLVESATMASTPSRPKASRSSVAVSGPISGAGSSFQSPVCSTLPSGVRSASAWDSGIECVTRSRLQSNGPTVNRSPGATTFSTAPLIPASSSLRQYQATQAFAALGDEARIGQHDLDPRQGLVGEAEAEVDHEPLVVQPV